MKNMTRFLTKTLYVSGLRCEKKLFYKSGEHEKSSEEEKFNPGLNLGPFMDGQEVGRLARQLFSQEGKLIECKKNLEGYRKTKDLIRSGEKIIFEGVFEVNEIIVRPDILMKKPNGTWDVIEVKSGSKIDSIYYDDLSIQYFVLKNYGLQMSQALLSIINPTYRRKAKLNLKELYVLKNVTGQVLKRQKYIVKKINKQKEILKGKEPIVDVGFHCKEPRKCSFHHLCWKDMPSETIYDISWLSKKEKLRYLENGIIALKDVPLTKIPYKDDELLQRNPSQTFDQIQFQRPTLNLKITELIQIQCAKDKKDHFVPEEINKFLSSILEPIYLFKIYFINSPIPFFRNTRTYEHIPYLFSFAKLENDQLVEEKQVMINFKSTGYDQMIEDVVTTFPKMGSFISFNSGNFYRLISKYGKGGQLEKWRERNPKYKKDIDNIIFNFRDVGLPFQKKYYYLNAFQGSHSESTLISNMFPELAKEQDKLIKDAYRKKPPLEYKFGNEMEEILINNEKYFKDYGKLGLKGIQLLFEELKIKSNQTL